MKFKGICLKGETKTNNGMIYSNEELKKIDAKDIPVTINNIGAPIGKCTVKYKNGNLYCEGEIDTEVACGYPAPKVLAKKVEEKDDVFYPKDIKILSIALVNKHSQDEVKMIEDKNARPKI